MVMYSRLYSGHPLDFLSYRITIYDVCFMTDILYTERLIGKWTTATRKEIHQLV